MVFSTLITASQASWELLTSWKTLARKWKISELTSSSLNAHKHQMFDCNCCQTKQKNGCEACIVKFKDNQLKKA